MEYQQIDRFRDEVETLRQLLEVQEQVALQQALSLERALEQLEARAKELEQSQRERDRQSRLLRSMLDSIADPVVVVDPAGSISLLNPAAELILGFQSGDSAADQVGCGLVSASMGGDLGSSEWILAKVLEERGPQLAEYRLRSEDGQQETWLSATARVVETESGQFSGAVAVFHDITYRKQAEAVTERDKNRALAASAAKSNYLAQTSHELRTPLNAILGYSALLYEEAEEAGDLDRQRDLSRIRVAGQHLQTLIGEVLDLSKIEAGKMVLDPQEVEVSALVQQVATIVSPLVQDNDNRFRLDLQDDLGRMYSDSTKVRQCLLNLIGNAMRFTHHGTITLRCRRPVEEWVVFQVSDQGIGMSSAELERVFQPFVQATASTQGKFGGTGLGLSLTKAITHLMGGEISAQSEQGSGSTFTLRLPTRVHIGNQAS